MKTWETPKLIALVRGRPEEAVLGTCKSMFPGLSEADYALNACLVTQLSPSACQFACSFLAVS